MNERGDAVLNAEANDNDGLGKALGVDLSGLDGLGRRDLLGRLKAADASGVASILGLVRKRGLELIRKYGEAEGRVAERAALKTPDARKLGRELLSLFSDLTSCELSKAGFQATTPTLNVSLIQERLSLCSVARGIHDSLNDKGKLEGSLKLLRRRDGQDRRYDVDGERERGLSNSTPPVIGRDRGDLALPRPIGRGEAP